MQTEPQTKACEFFREGEGSPDTSRLPGSNLLRRRLSMSRLTLAHDALRATLAPTTRRTHEVAVKRNRSSATADLTSRTIKRETPRLFLL